MLRFRFPIVIIDEDYRSENTSGLGIRALAEAIEKMPPIERTVLSLYYHEEMTLREIAKIVDLHESRVSQLKSQAILRLRASFQSRGECARCRGGRLRSRLAR